MFLLQEKATQAINILKETDIDLWLTFVRETSGVRDPVLDFLIGPRDLTWQSALMLTQSVSTSPSLAILKRKKSANWVYSIQFWDMTKAFAAFCVKPSRASIPTG